MVLSCFRWNPAFLSLLFCVQVEGNQQAVERKSSKKGRKISNHPAEGKRRKSEWESVVACCLRECLRLICIIVVGNHQKVWVWGCCRERSFEPQLIRKRSHSALLVTEIALLQVKEPIFPYLLEKQVNFASSRKIFCSWLLIFSILLWNWVLDIVLVLQPTK